MKIYIRHDVNYDIMMLFFLSFQYRQELNKFFNTKIISEVEMTRLLDDVVY